MVTIFWTTMGLVLLALLVGTYIYDRRMRDQGRSVRSSSDMARDNRDNKSDARAFRNRMQSPSAAADDAIRLSAERRRQGETHRPDRRAD